MRKGKGGVDHLRHPIPASICFSQKKVSLTSFYHLHSYCVHLHPYTLVRKISLPAESFPRGSGFSQFSPYPHYVAVVAVPEGRVTSYPDFSLHLFLPAADPDPTGLKDKVSSSSLKFWSFSYEADYFHRNCCGSKICDVGGRAR